MKKVDFFGDKITQKWGLTVYGEVSIITANRRECYMGKMNCVCEISDNEYRKALENMLIYSGWFNVVEAKDKHEICENLIWFIDKDYYDSFLNTDNNTSCVVLLSESDDDTHISDDNLQLLEVFKYIPFSELLVKVSDYFDLELTFNRNRQLGEGEGIKTIGVFSTSGGCGTTVIAQSIGRKFYRMGYKVLYLDLTPISLNWISGSVDQMSRLLYGIIRGRNFSIDEFTTFSNGIHYIPEAPMGGYPDIIDRERIKTILESCGKADYDIVIFDIGNHLMGNNIKSLGQMDFGVCVFPVNEKLLKSDFKVLNEVAKKSPPKTFMVLNDSRGIDNEKRIVEQFAQRKNEEEGDRIIDFMIPYYKNFLDRDIDREFGEKIGELTEIIMGNMG